MRTLSLAESVKMLKKHGIKFAEHGEAKTSEELNKICKRIGFPIAMKINSKQISHKTESGGVEINISNFSEAKKVFGKMRKLKGFESVLVQKMLKGKEIIIGGKRDVQFGGTVLVGLGGIFVEIFQDVQIGICPVNTKTAREMIETLKAYPLLKGYRGKKGVNLKKLEEIIVKVSKLMEKNESIIELDLNPLIGDEKNITAVDARVVVE
ncbi:MAG TPA: acetate--CoA ligase family protein [archaeon]|nr:acetate--CoA ligase family protein [archaeon]